MANAVRVCVCRTTNLTRDIIDQTELDMTSKFAYHPHLTLEELLEKYGEAITELLRMPMEVQTTALKECMRDRRLEMCKHGRNCRKRTCNFAHGLAQLAAPARWEYEHVRNTYNVLHF